MAREVASSKPLDVKDLQPPLCMLLVRDWNAITRKALRFAMNISPEVYALHIAADEESAVDVREKWAQFVVYPTTEAGIPTPRLVVVPSPYALRPPAVIANYWKIAEHFEATVVGGVPTSLVALTTSWAEGSSLSADALVALAVAEEPAEKRQALG